MIKLLQHNEIDKALWNEKISKAQNALPYAYAWVLDILHPNWQALVLGNYEAIMPLVFEQKMGLYLLRQSPWIQQLGVFSEQKLSEKNYQAFFKAIPKRFRKLYFRVNYENAQFQQLDVFEIQERKNLVVDLNRGYENLYSQFSKNTKRNIKKAEKQALKIEKNISVSEIVDIYKTFQAPKHQFLLAEDYEKLPVLLNAILANKSGFIWGAKNEANELLAANFFWQNNNRIISLLPATTHNGRTASVMFFIVNELIKTKANSDFILDFEGSNQENIARFNKGFGAKEQNYLELAQRKFPFL